MSFKVFEVSKTEYLTFNVLDKLVACLQLDIGIRGFKFVDNIGFVFEEDFESC